MIETFIFDMNVTKVTDTSIDLTDYNIRYSELAELAYDAKKCFKGQKYYRLAVKKW